MKTENENTNEPKEVVRDVEICGRMLPQKENDRIYIDFITNDATCFGGGQDNELYRFSFAPIDFLEWFDNNSIYEIKQHIFRKYCT